MVFVEQRKTARVLLVLSLIWVFGGCANQNPPLRPAPEEPPLSEEIKAEPLVSEPLMPEGPKSEAAVVPDTLPFLEVPEIKTPKPLFYIHKVRWPEETLSHIAKWHTGTVKNWIAIAKANPGLDPKKIDIGDTISIPVDLMTSPKPMPHSFVRAKDRKKSTPLSSSKKISTPSESSKLFDPIESKPSRVKTDSAKLFGPIETRQPSTEPGAAILFGPIE